MNAMIKQDTEPKIAYEFAPDGELLINISFDTPNADDKVRDGLKADFPEKFGFSHHDRKTDGVAVVNFPQIKSGFKIASGIDIKDVANGVDDLPSSLLKILGKDQAKQLVEKIAPKSLVKGFIKTCRKTHQEDPELEGLTDEEKAKKRAEKSILGSLNKFFEVIVENAESMTEMMAEEPDLHRRIRKVAPPVGNNENYEKAFRLTNMIMGGGSNGPKKPGQGPKPPSPWE